MSQGQNQTASTVLVLEADPSLRRLISLGLQHHGLSVIETNSLATLSPATVNAVDLLVLDVDSGVTSDWSLLETVQEHAQLSALPAVVLAWESSSALHNTRNGSAQSELTCMPKPFDARTLQQAVEQLLTLKAARATALEAQAEARLLASYPAHTKPSIWPMITAAGLLLAVTGMLFQVALAILGILIVITALLLWTLGSTKPASTPATMGVINP
jgi:CheY-like chemotaxis protein